MGGTSEVLCRYHLYGACKLGSQCAFSHSLDNAESQVCRFYQRGECSYGDRCRYMHVKPDWGPRKPAGAAAAAAGSSSYVPPSAAGPRPAADSLADQLPISQLRLGGLAAATADAAPGPAGAAIGLPQNPFDGAEGDGSEWGWEQQQPGQPQHGQQPQEQHIWAEEGEGEYWEGEYEQEWEEEGAWEEGEEGWAATDQQAAAAGGGGGEQQQDLPLSLPLPLPWSVPEGAAGGQQWAASSHPSLRSLCMQWFSTGACSKGERCHLVHGELCQHCHKHALHPSDPAARQQHLSECALRHERLAARARSSAVECGICLESVLGKAAPGERKFGLLTGCDHPFCLRCIREWRQKTDAGADLDTALRTCPVCRITSHFIVPSLVWPSSGEEKERVVEGYKAKLSTIDCRLFNYGEGTCPFSTSCFYRHAFPDGRLEDVAGSLRKAADEEGHIRVMQPVRLSDFIAISTAGQRLGGGRRGR